MCGHKHLDHRGMKSWGEESTILKIVCFVDVKSLSHEGNEVPFTAQSYALQERILT